MTATEIIEEAWKQLPFTSDVEMDRYMVTVQKKHLFDIDFIMLANDTPTIYDQPFYIVEFQKQYVEGIVIGWEFVQFIDGMV